MALPVRPLLRFPPTGPSPYAGVSLPTEPLTRLLPSWQSCLHSQVRSWAAGQTGSPSPGQLLASLAFPMWQARLRGWCRFQEPLWRAVEGFLWKVSWAPRPASLPCSDLRGCRPGESGLTLATLHTIRSYFGKLLRCSTSLS